MATGEKPKDSYFLSWPVTQLVTNKPLPGDIYLCIRHKFIKYKNMHDEMLPHEYDKLIFHNVKILFIDEGKKEEFTKWYSVIEVEEKAQDRKILESAAAEDIKEIVEVTQEMRRTALDIFSNPIGDDQIKEAVNMSKKMVTEFLKKPFVVFNVSQLQKYGRGVVDHSVNVSVLSVYLGLRMGYSSKVILEHLAMGGLMHDIGKTLMGLTEDQVLDKEDAAKENDHPILGKNALEPKNTHQASDYAKEVQMIVAQHHEYLDGTGYPNKLKGLAVYDLARVVTIANEYDNLVSQIQGEAMKEKMEGALKILSEDFKGKLDSKKLEKAIRAIGESIEG